MLLGLLGKVVLGWAPVKDYEWSLVCTLGYEMVVGLTKLVPVSVLCVLGSVAVYSILMVVCGCLRECGWWILPAMRA